jgi:hypothetical protein
VLGSITPRDDWLMPVYAAAATWFGPFIRGPVTPLGMYVAGAVAPVVAREGVPQVYLTPGTHELSGRFVWSTRPEQLLHDGDRAAGVAKCPAGSHHRNRVRPRERTPAQAPLAALAERARHRPPRSSPTARTCGSV